MSYTQQNILLSKTTFLYGSQCTRRLWLYKHLRKERDLPDEKQQAIFKRGIDNGLLAQQLFPGGVDASPENPWSYGASVQKTQRWIREGYKTIYEAAFLFKGIMCAVDILVRKNNKWYAFEVKGAYGVKPVHIEDAALQYYVIKGAALQLEDFSIIHLNPQYEEGASIHLPDYFNSRSVLEETIEKQESVAAAAQQFLEVIQLKMPPVMEMSDHCQKPYPCDFQGFCSRWAGKS